MREIARHGWGAVLCALLVLLVACGQEGPPAHDGPIVLVTFDSLRADAVGGLGGLAGDPGSPKLTPNLDALIREADWSGRAIASSSWGLPSMASLFTGLRPWQHQVLRPEDRLAPELPTLAEALQAHGYETLGFSGEPMYSQEAGFGQGFELLTKLGKGTEAGQKLRSATGRRFVWAHFSEPQAPYFQRPNLAARLGLQGLGLPNRVLPHQLAPFFDPAVPLPPELAKRFRTMYRLNVAWADDRLGRLLGELKASGQWDRTLLVVTSTHGEEFGEKGQILNGGNLGRQLLEVPLVIKLPKGFLQEGRRIAVPPGQRVATARLWATLVEAVGGEAPPAQAPSLFRPAPAAVLSELYLTNGTNRFSLVRGGRPAALGSPLRSAGAGVLPRPAGPHEPRQRPHRPRRALGAAGPNLPPAPRGVPRYGTVDRGRGAPARPGALGGAGQPARLRPGGCAEEGRDGPDAPARLE